MVTQTFVISGEAGMEILKPAWTICGDPNLKTNKQKKIAQGFDRGFIQHV